MGHGQTIKLHLKKAVQHLGWHHVPPKDLGPNIGKPYEMPHCGDDTNACQTGCSPLTSELLAPGETVSNVLDYEGDMLEDVPEDVQEDVQEDPEITQVVAHIPKATDDGDVEMKDEDPALGFEPKIGRSGMMST